MDGPTFFSIVIASLAWPVTVIVLVCRLRPEISLLISFLKKVKAGPIEAEFEREVKELRTEVEADLPVPADPVSPARQRILQLANISPRSAIIEAWQMVEFAAQSLVLPITSSPTEKVETATRQWRRLQSSGRLTRSQVSMYADLRGLRNQAVHAPDFNPSYEATLNYIEAALRLSESIAAQASASTADPAPEAPAPL